MSQIVRAGSERACKEFTAKIAPLGLQRTLIKFWTRRNLHTVDFIHLHRRSISYGSHDHSVAFRVHFGIRILNDPFRLAVPLNGPGSDDGEFLKDRYHLRFNALTWSTYERCIDDLLRITIERGEPWFQRFRSPDALLKDPCSPLTISPSRPEMRDASKQALIDAMAGRALAENERASLKLLGMLRPPKRTAAAKTPKAGETWVDEAPTSTNASSNVVVRR